MKLHLTFIYLILVVAGLHAQTTEINPPVYASFSSFASTGKELPFWFRANQNGAFPIANNTTQLVRAGYSKALDPKASGYWDYFFGAALVAGLAGEVYVQPNQYWGGVRLRGMVFKVGAMADPIRFAGLSSTNGNLDASNNARPVPKITLSTNGFVPIDFLPDWFKIKGLYEEGMLWDSSYVDNAHLHHKNLYFRVDLPDKLNISFGIEHYVFWGGVSPTLGKLPGWEAYFDYVFGKEGGSGTTEDPFIVQGNPLGLYNLEVNKTWKKSQLTFYWNHPFEDGSGLEFKNLPDGLWGVHWGEVKPKRKLLRQKKKLVTDFVYEFMYTMHQSGDPAVETGRGGDDYFNDSRYQLIYTHYAQMMGTPLFVPALKSRWVATGFESTRMWMHHLGLKGNLKKNMGWKIMCTYSENLGTNQNVYPEPLTQLSVLGEVNYQRPKTPWKFSASLANDSGTSFENRFGLSLGVTWQPL